ncbi:E2/UBC family protein [Rhodanobacter soli]
MQSELTDIDTDTKAKAGDRWKLKVQGVVLEFNQPEVKVADAMAQAGFDPTKAWHIYLIVHGQKSEVTAEQIVDLRTPGIEKIRLMQRNVDNGEGKQLAPRRLFKLLAADHAYLDSLGLRWETVFEGERRWLLIHDYPLPTGYAPGATTLALDIPKDYPASQVDMFYFAPFVGRTNGVEIPRVQVRATIDGVEYQGWSRHRNAASAWDSAADNVRTHLVLVESCLAKELGE